MIKVTLVGTGTVSQHLQQVFSKTENVGVIKVISSRGDSLSKALKMSSKHDKGEPELEQPDIYIVAVTDDAIETVSKKLVNSKKIIVHTSGSVSIDALPKGVRKGVFYPLQSFSPGRKVDFKTIPICIEAEKKENLELLQKLGESISESVYEVSSEQRKSLHLAAVFVNNFTNHIYQIGKEICKENAVPFDILKPLIAETAQKLDALSPLEAQTGPAKRKDMMTIEKHLEQLNNKTHKEVYQILTKSIKETYGEKL
ncbi:DUF2520 domain-containing protein [Maribacter algarum]|uniref:DUF2520 domain-containing protein n=1 Tax=Maribacter algarum (ex Zhang et al. 2020) TaxID=2578118 RepID=A0A5S3PS67_9FLAO|nr:DUF2520 domain-containing protein [Maribacter algarum]TMM57524.1 DUF2520 domain-containing protein [Maribacter algarum]